MLSYEDQLKVSNVYVWILSQDTKEYPAEEATLGKSRKVYSWA